MKAIYTPIQKALFGANPVTQITFQSQEGTLSFREVLQGLRDSNDIRAVFIDSIKVIRSSGYYFELPVLTISNVDRPFECVIVDGPPLKKLVQNPSPFNEYFKTEDRVVAFSNLGGDAILVVPTPCVKSPVYAHMASFIRGAPEGQVSEFWRLVAEEALKRLSHCPFWISTAGLGVSWLHLRLDSRPKYYRHKPYKKLG